MTLQEKLSEIAHYDKSSYNSIARSSAMKMYEWAKEQFIQNACKYIKKNVCEHISHNQIYKDYKQEEVIGYQLVVDEQFYVDFKKEMEGKGE